MDEISKKISEKLLEIKAVSLNPVDYYTWASGWFSPIYCDNRKILSYPEIRSYFCSAFVDKINKLSLHFDIVAGVATGAIALGVLVADRLNKPFVYVRPKSKEHGLGNQIEGVVIPGQKVLVIEDLISTGGSSLLAVNALQKANLEIVSMLAIFTYNFNVSKDAFAHEKINLHTLSNYDDLVNVALENNYIKENDIQLLREWRISPGTWKK